jgi:hypothetical protein
MSNLKDIATLCKEIDHLTAEVDTLRARGDDYKQLFTFWLNQATVIRNDRNEAQQQICRMVFTNGGIPPAEYAKKMGWDCFKDKVK